MVIRLDSLTDSLQRDSQTEISFFFLFCQPPGAHPAGCIREGRLRGMKGIVYILDCCCTFVERGVPADDEKRRDVATFFYICLCYLWWCST